MGVPCWSSVQLCSVTQLCLTLCNPMDCSTPVLPVHHQLLELTQTHVHRVNVPSNHLITCRLLSSCLQSFPASGSFPMGQFFASGGQSIGVSASASVLPMNIQDWFPLGWTWLRTHLHLLPQEIWNKMLCVRKALPWDPAFKHKSKIATLYIMVWFWILLNFFLCSSQ